MRKIRFRRDDLHGAFSMIELLVVMTIMGILLYLAVPASVSLQQSSNLNLAGQAVADEIAVAREMAAGSNRVVEVRFLIPSTWTAQSRTGYHAMQLWAPNESGVPVPADRVITLPDSVEISVNSTLSPLLSTTMAAAATSTPPGTNPVGNYVFFRVRPAGTVTVSGTAPGASGTNEDSSGTRAPKYFFTLVPVRNDAATTLPANYLMLQINPDTGRTQTYRP